MVQQLKPFLNNLVQLSKWNFDLEDCDKILRVDSPIEIAEAVIKLLRDKDFYCEELQD